MNDECRYCHRKNHTVDFCPYLRCNICGLQGHKTLKCKMKRMRSQPFFNVCIPTQESKN